MAEIRMEQMVGQTVTVETAPFNWHGTIQAVNGFGVFLERPEGELIFLPWMAVLAVRSLKKGE